MIRETREADEQRVRYAWNLAMCREPTERELLTAMSLVEEKSAAGDGVVSKPMSDTERFARLALAIFNLNEFLYVD